MDLKTKRLQKEITQTKLGELCGCDRSMIAKIESGEARPSIRLAKVIAEVLGFDWTSFYKDEDTNTKGD